MHKPRTLVAVVVMLLVAILVGTFGLGWRENNEDSYRRTLRNYRVARWLKSASSRLPRVLKTRFDFLEIRAESAWFNEKIALLASGFLTNISIPYTGSPKELTAAYRRLDRFQKEDPDFVFIYDKVTEFTSEHRVFEITCRSNEVIAARKIINGY